MQIKTILRIVAKSAGLDENGDKIKAEGEAESVVED